MVQDKREMIKVGVQLTVSLACSQNLFPVIRSVVHCPRAALVSKDRGHWAACREEKKNLKIKLAFQILLLPSGGILILHVG